MELDRNKNIGRFMSFSYGVKRWQDTEAISDNVGMWSCEWCGRPMCTSELRNDMCNECHIEVGTDYTCDNVETELVELINI